MKNFKHLIIALICLSTLFVSCKKDSAIQNKSPLSIIDTVKIDTIRSFGNNCNISGYSITPTILTFYVNYPSNSSVFHTFTLHSDGKWEKINPANININLFHNNNGDNSGPLKYDTLNFVITPLRYPTSNIVKIKLDNTLGVILYNY